MSCNQADAVNPNNCCGIDMLCRICSQELRQNFHKGPMQWWARCISEQGALNITSAIDLASREHVPESPRITPPAGARQRRAQLKLSQVTLHASKTSTTTTLIRTRAQVRGRIRSLI